MIEQTYLRSFLATLVFLRKFLTKFEVYNLLATYNKTNVHQIVTFSKVNSMSNSNYSVYTNLYVTKIDHTQYEQSITFNISHKHMHHLQLMMTYFCLNES